MAVLPGGRFLATASPVEIRGWVRLPSPAKSVSSEAAKFEVWPPDELEPSPQSIHSMLRDAQRPRFFSKAPASLDGVHNFRL
eukprot:Skav224651  [mRNA]  locus=scaffold4300:98390:98635:+ [translate_table: standard]